MFNFLDVRKHLSLFSILLVAFIDQMGIGLVFPLFAFIVFDENLHFISENTSYAMRGILLGTLIALTPLTQFIASPFLGALSDSKGRKKLLILGITAAMTGYSIAILACFFKSILLFFCYRLIVGLSDGSLAVAQAAIADLSSDKLRTRYFSLFNMACGTGWAIGPFIGGVLSDPKNGAWCSITTPFIFAWVIALINLVLVIGTFQETRKLSKKVSFKLTESFENILKAFKLKSLRVLFLSCFTFIFGWTFYSEFSALYLIEKFQFTSGDVGNFWGVAAFWFALSSGIFISPIISRYSAHQIYVGASFLLGIYMLALLAIGDVFWLWFYIPLQFFLVALVMPTISSLVSHQAGENNQGEVLGIYHSINALAMSLSPLIIGSIVAYGTEFVVWGGGMIILLACGVYVVGVRGVYRINTSASS